MCYISANLCVVRIHACTLISLRSAAVSTCSVSTVHYIMMELAL